MISESCGCGAAFSAERQDELKLLNSWRTSHKCKPSEGNLAIVDSSRSEIAAWHPIGFSPFPDVEEEDDSKRV